jgi:hypothetical protein
VDSNGVPVPEMRGLRGRVRSRVNALFAEGISLAPPDGHGNGHAEGEERAEGEHAAVGAGGPAEVEDGSGRPDGAE